MIHAQTTKFVSVTPPGAKLDDASATTATIDTLGYDYLEVFAYLGDTDIAAAALSIAESNASNMSSSSTVLAYGTDTNIAGSTSALPTADDDNKCFKFEIDLKNRKRYLDVTFTAGNGSTGSYVAIWAILSRASEPKTTASDRGHGDILRV